MADATYKHKESGLTETVEAGSGYEDHFRSSPDWEKTEKKAKQSKAKAKDSK